MSARTKKLKVCEIEGLATADDGALVHFCTREDMHPYACEGGPCIHCDRRSTKDHRPTLCYLCGFNEPEEVEKRIKAWQKRRKARAKKA